MFAGICNLIGLGNISSETVAKANHSKITIYWNCLRQTSRDNCFAVKGSMQPGIQAHKCPVRLFGFPNGLRLSRTSQAQIKISRSQEEENKVSTGDNV